MKCIAKVAFVSLFYSFLAFGQITQDKDPGNLLRQAKALLGPRVGNDVIAVQVVPLLRQANAIWAQSLSSDHQYAESLDLLAILLRGQEENWRDEAAPLAGRALEIFEAQASSQPSADLALALELQADVLGHEQSGASAGAPFWNRASTIRGQLVADVVRTASSASNEPSVSVLVLPQAVYRIGNGVSQPTMIKNSIRNTLRSLDWLKTYAPCFSP